MRILQNSSVTRTFVILALIILTFSASSCSSSKQKASGDLKRTQYCERYREFDDKVATASEKEQKELLVNITKAKDFPSSLLEDYTTLIDGYDEFLAGKPVVQDEKTYEQASKRITRHAIDHCELLKSNSGASV